MAIWLCGYVATWLIKKQKTSNAIHYHPIQKSHIQNNLNALFISGQLWDNSDRLYVIGIKYYRKFQSLIISKFQSSENHFVCLIDTDSIFKLFKNCLDGSSEFVGACLFDFSKNVECSFVGFYKKQYKKSL